MITLFLMVLVCFIYNLQLSIPQDTQAIVLAICIASDINIFSRMIENLRSK